MKRKLVYCIVLLLLIVGITFSVRGRNTPYMAWQRQQEARKREVLLRYLPNIQSFLESASLGANLAYNRLHVFSNTVEAEGTIVESTLGNFEGKWVGKFNITFAFMDHRPEPSSVLIRLLYDQAWVKNKYKQYASIEKRGYVTSSLRAEGTEILRLMQLPEERVAKLAGTEVRIKKSASGNRILSMILEEPIKQYPVIPYWGDEQDAHVTVVETDRVAELLRAIFGFDIDVCTRAKSVESPHDIANWHKLMNIGGEENGWIVDHNIVIAHYKLYPLPPSEHRYANLKVSVIALPKHCFTEPAIKRLRDHYGKDQNNAPWRHLEVEDKGWGFDLYMDGKLDVPKVADEVRKANHSKQ